MSSSALGKAAERRVKDDLEANGYTIVTSHLSRGAADFVAAKPGQRLAVQVKRSLRSGGGVGPVEWNELIEIAVAFEALPVVAIAFPRKPVRYLHLTDRKDGSRRKQPWIDFLIDFAAGATA